jgi:hypothetical protein
MSDVQHLRTSLEDVYGNLRTEFEVWKMKYTSQLGQELFVPSFVNDTLSEWVGMSVSSLETHMVSSVLLAQWMPRSREVLILALNTFWQS